VHDAADIDGNLPALRTDLRAEVIIIIIIIIIINRFV